MRLLRFLAPYVAATLAGLVALIMFLALFTLAQGAEAMNLAVYPLWFAPVAAASYLTARRRGAIAGVVAGLLANAFWLLGTAGALVQPEQTDLVRMAVAVSAAISMLTLLGGAAVGAMLRRAAMPERAPVEAVAEPAAPRQLAA